MKLSSNNDGVLIVLLVTVVEKTIVWIIVLHFAAKYW